MALQPRHEARWVGTPILREAAPSVQAALGDLRALWDPESDSLSRLDGPGVDRFLERYMPLRDRLAWRAARLERLTPTERAVLHAIDGILARLDRRTEPLPDDVRQIVADVLRRR